MELELNTIGHDDLSTEGVLSVDGFLQCYTLELPIKNGLPGSAIPEGRFPVVLQPSPKFQASPDPWVGHYASAMPHIVDIPNRSLIMIHWGNNPKETEGCVLVGEKRGQDFIFFSRPAFSRLYEKIHDAAQANSCFISIRR